MDSPAAPEPPGAPDSTGRILRWLAALLVRGPHAPFVLGDLEEALRRDVARGLPLRRARWRYATNALGSAFRLWRARVRFPSPRLPSIGVSWLDVKLGVRMLVKYPGLTAVAVFALALGIPASLTPVHLLNIFDAPLPFDEGERIVGLRHRYIAVLEEAPGTLHEYTVWRERLSSFERIGAARSDRYNVIAEDGRARPYRGARITASSFAILRVPPLLGRPLVEADEVIGAPDVVVIGHHLWQSLLGGDPKAVGRTLRIGGTPHTVVGVMPEGFLFPDHEHLWLPLREAARAHEPGQGPALWIFGRLADGVTEEQASAEMTVVDRGLVEAFPDVYGELRPEIVPFAYLTTGNPKELKWLIAPFHLLALLLLAVACGNVGTLILARTATRSGEVAVRTALGASRARIVSQLFVESLVLALLATGVGLVIAGFVAERWGRVVGALPFWMDFGLNRRTVGQALGLAVFSAVIAGVVPALKATGRHVRGSMQGAAPGASAIRFGGVTTVLIVVEVALGVACLFGGAVGYRMIPRDYSAEMGIRTDRFLAAWLRIGERMPAAPGPDADPDPFRTRVASAEQALVHRLAAEPGVRGIAIASSLPGQTHSVGRVQVEAADFPEDLRGHRVLRARVDVGFFEGLGQPILNGRDFAASDLPARDDEESDVVIVNTAFVERVLHGRNAIGRRVRTVARGGAEPGPWYEIVGVVGHLGMIGFEAMPDDAGLYHPVAPGTLHPVPMAIRVSADPVAFGARLRRIAAEVDPTAMIGQPVRLSELVSDERAMVHWIIFAFAVVAGIAVVLSVAGLYALMAFTVAQRTHEIGVRTALGADPARIISVIVRRALAQLAVGVLAGVAASAFITAVAVPDIFLLLKGWPVLLAGAAATVIAVGMAACIAPTLRGLRIRPMDALRV